MRFMAVLLTICEGLPTRLRYSRCSWNQWTGYPATVEILELWISKRHMMNSLGCDFEAPFHNVNRSMCNAM